MAQVAFNKIFITSNIVLSISFYPVLSILGDCFKYQITNFLSLAAEEL